jgi:hypothetical protein
LAEQSVPPSRPIAFKEKMNPFTLYTLSVNPFRSWSAFAWKTGEMMLASGQVIGHRSNRMFSAGHSPGAGDRRESALMGQEKLAAASESSQAVAFSLLRLNQQFGAIAFKQMLMATAAIISVATSHTPGQSVARQTKFVRDKLADSAVATSQLSKSAARIAHRGLKPIHSRTSGNAKRLAKR